MVSGTRGKIAFGAIIFMSQRETAQDQKKLTGGVREQTTGRSKQKAPLVERGASYREREEVSAPYWSRHRTFVIWITKRTFRAVCRGEGIHRRKSPLS